MTEPAIEGEIIPDSTSREPAINVGLITTMLTSIYVIINDVWPNLLSNDIQNSITNIAIILIPIILGWVIRMKVWSPASAAKLQKEIAVLKAKNLALEKFKPEQ